MQASTTRTSYHYRVEKLKAAAMTIPTWWKYLTNVWQICTLQTLLNNHFQASYLPFEMSRMWMSQENEYPNILLGKIMVFTQLPFHLLFHTLLWNKVNQKMMRMNLWSAQQQQQTVGYIHKQVQIYNMKYKLFKCYGSQSEVIWFRCKPNRFRNHWNFI